MAPRVGRVARRAAPAAPARVDMSKIRVSTHWVPLDEIKPYENNARFNDDAVEAVMESIRQFGFIVPVVIDEDGILAAGHTRHRAAERLGMDAVLAVRAEHLTAAQIDAFRIVDNKVAEIAEWDTDLLADEIARLKSEFDFTDFGFSQDEIDCLSSLVTSDCLSTDNLAAPATESEQGTGGGTTGRRGPQSTRVVIGDIVLFIPTENYRVWADGIRRHNNFQQADIEADIKNRLGMTE